MNGGRHGPVPARSCLTRKPCGIQPRRTPHDPHPQRPGPGRQTTRTIDGEVDTDNDVVEDFTLAELKHSTSMRGVSLAQGRSATYFEDTLVSTLHAAAGDKRSFTDLLTPAGLAFIAGYADGIGPWKPYLVKTVADGVDRIGDQLGFADPQAEMAYFMRLGVDGVFTDFPDTGVAALQAAAVPEPQTWALLLGGLALVGGLRQRQQRAGRPS